jgi:hypothetical protein
MPIGPNCRSCGAPLPPDLGWCQRCLAPVTPHAVRPPIHEPGSYVGAPIATPRTSRWRAGPTTFGPLGRILCTVAVVSFFPWWGLGGFNPLFLWTLMGWLIFATVFVRSIWQPARILHGEEPTAGERFRERHPLLGRPLRLSRQARLVVVAMIALGAIAAWLGMDSGARYLWAVVAIVSGVAFLLASADEL